MSEQATCRSIESTSSMGRLRGGKHSGGHGNRPASQSCSVRSCSAVPGDRPPASRCHPGGSTGPSMRPLVLPPPGSLISCSLTGVRGTRPSVPPWTARRPWHMPMTLITPLAPHGLRLVLNAIRGGASLTDATALIDVSMTQFRRMRAKNPKIKALVDAASSMQRRQRANSTRSRSAHRGYRLVRRDGA